MKKISILLLALIGMSQAAIAQIEENPRQMYSKESCTSIMVGKKASTDGSVITSHTCDAWYRTWIAMRKAQKFDRDTTETIYSGRMHTEYPNDMTGLKEKGRIPQAKFTYKFLDTSYPSLNEKQLAMGETTISGRKELVNPKGMFYIEELQRIALERCSTAREAIKLIGQLIEKYGYADWGECITIADKDEVWQMEIFGEGKDKIGGLWAAQRIPDDHVGVSANISRISKIGTDPEYFMASKNVKSVAKKLGFWDGKEPFVFWKAYGDVKKAYMAREFYVLSSFAPSQGLKFDDREEMPFSVKPDKKISVQDVMAMYREYYEGSDLDMIKGLKMVYTDRKTGKTDTIVSPAANPWMSSFERGMINYQKKDAVIFNRPIAVAFCAYSTIIQLRSWLPDEIGGVVWFGYDNPAESPRIPIFAGCTDFPKSYKICGQHSQRDDAAVWAFRKANKLATLRWGANKDMIRKQIKRFEDKGMRELPWVEKEYMKILKEEGKEKATEFLNDYTKDFAGAAMLQWNEMARELWNKYQMGF